MEIMQPNFAAGIIGKTTSFNCRLRYGEGKVTRVHMYVYIMDTSNKMEVVHPSIDESYKKRLSVSENGDKNGKSVQISDLHFNDTNMYYCKMSVVEEKGSSTVTGNGTLLFVHGPLNLRKEISTAVCEVQVRIVEDVEIVWTDEDTESAAENTTVEIAEHGTSRIISRLSMLSEPPNPGLTTKISCLLRHKSGGYISKQSITMSGKFFAQKQTREEPMVLYIVTLANRLLLLIIVLVIFKFKHRSM